MSSTDSNDNGNSNDHPPPADSNITRYNLRGGDSPYRRGTADNNASSSTLPHSVSTAATRRARPPLPKNTNSLSSRHLQQAQCRAASSSTTTTLADSGQTTGVSSTVTASAASSSTPTPTDPPHTFCVICREDILPAGLSAEALRCGHVFHSACIRHWWSMKPRSPKHCAICKRIMFEESSDEDDVEVVEQAMPTDVINPAAEEPTTHRNASSLSTVSATSLSFIFDMSINPPTSDNQPINPPTLINPTASINPPTLINPSASINPPASSTAAFTACTARVRAVSRTQQSSTTNTRPSTMRGQGFNHTETNALLDLVQIHLPISARDWDNIARSHLVYYPESR
jgi:hypothetical protein